NITRGSLTVNVEDDSPTAIASTQTVRLPYQDTNVMLMLDISGSMSTDADGVAGGPTRLDVMKQSVAAMLDQYDNLGDVKVRVVTFSTSAAAYQTTWISVADAKTYVNGLTAGGNTNYDAALLTARTAFTSAGKIAGATNVSYFLTDGTPNGNQDWDGTGPLPAQDGIQPGEEALWKTFLSDNAINSFAYGMGTGATQANMDPVAYNGITKTDTNSIVVSDINQLPPILRDSIVTPAGGALTDGTLGAGSGIGADGGHLANFTLNGTTYAYGSGTPTGGTNRGTYDAATNTWTVNTLAGGKFVVDMDDGKYTYTAPPTTTTAYNEAIGYTLIDNDGDTAGSTLTINVLPPQTVTLVSTTSTITSLNLGLAGEYFGYNDTRTGTPTDPLYSGANRLHSDDGSAKFGAAGTSPNLDNLADAESIIEGRNANTNIVGVGVKSNPNAADATFSANKVEFGLATGSTTPYFGDNLGRNNAVTAGNTVGTGNNLYTFLNTASNNVDGLKATSGVGATSDAIIRMVGYIYIPAGGTYDLRITGDDGYRVLIGGQTVAQVDQIQSTTTNTFTGKVLSEGMQLIEIVYWDQGGAASLRVEVKTSGAADSTYKIIGTDEFALFAPGDVPTLAANQDIVETSTNGTYAIRTGKDYTGTDTAEKIVGSDGKDTIRGGGGNDNINGGDGSDYIEGGKGNDVLTGGLGGDTFAWKLADHGTAGAPEKDIISDFNTAASTAGGDVLDLRDLLQGETGATLTKYLHFTTSGGDTVINISSTGAYGATFDATKTDQTITLTGVTLTGATDAAIIQDLLNKGKLITD
ncbi:type I secretion C-terminal target domain-containing protein, partial [Ideonella margarita]